MSKWATIDRQKLQQEIDKRSAALDAIGTKTRDSQKAFEGFLLLAEHNTLVAIANSISRDDTTTHD